jgi:hypothetical protein
VSIEEALARASAKPAGKRPYFLEPEVERVLAITMALVQELAVARTRVDTLERLLEAKGVLSREEIETFAPTPEQTGERSLWTQEYIVRVLRIVQQESEAIQAAAKGDLSSGEVATEINK